MVLTTRVGNGTDAVVRHGGGPTRRRVLATTAGVALAGTAASGCGIFDGDDPVPPPPDPLQPVLDEALALAAAYDRAVAAQPALAKRLTPLAADHRAHADELARVIGRGTPSAAAPSASAPAPDAADTLAELRAAERRAQRTAAAAARQAPAERAALIGSVAACRASHAEALR